MTMMPWLVRDYGVMGHFVLIRDNSGNELRIGNNPLAEGQYVLAYHPSQNLFCSRSTSAWASMLSARPGPAGETVDRAESGKIY